MHLFRPCGRCKSTSRPCEDPLQILRELSGVGGTLSTAILLIELDSMPLPDMWLVRAVNLKFWNGLADLPSHHLYHRMLVGLSACRAAVTSSVKNWACFSVQEHSGSGYDMDIRIDSMDCLDLSRVT